MPDQDVPYKLLAALHLGGKEGVHVPTLQQFLACVAALPCPN